MVISQETKEREAKFHEEQAFLAAIDLKEKWLIKATEEEIAQVVLPFILKPFTAVDMERMLRKYPL